MRIILASPVLPSGIAATSKRNTTLVSDIIERSLALYYPDVIAKAPLPDVATMASPGTPACPFLRKSSQMLFQAAVEEETR